MSRFDLNLLVPLDMLLRERNVTAAAKKLGVSQPTMSGMLQRLREQFEDPLLTRVGKAFELTPRAEELAEHARQALLAVEGLVKQRSAFEPAQAHRNFRIMGSDFSVLFVLPDIFRAAAEAAPSLTFEVLPVYAPAEQVYEGWVDLCLTGDNASHIHGAAASVLRTQVIGGSSFVGLVDEDHPLSGQISLEQYLSYPRASAQFPGVRQSVEDYAVVGLSRSHPARIRVPSFFALGAMVSGTDMIATLPSRFVPILPACWGLRAIELPVEFTQSRLRLYWHSRFDRDPVHQWLRELIISRSRGLSA